MTFTKRNVSARCCCAGSDISRAWKEIAQRRDLPLKIVSYVPDARFAPETICPCALPASVHCDMRNIAVDWR